MFSLPQDVLTIVMQKLSFQDALLFGATCQYLHAIANTDDVWMEKCRLWETKVKLLEWRKHAQSGKALFRLLRNLSCLIGTWSSVGLYPRGALLFITWGTYSLTASKVLPESLGQVSFVPAFEVIGCPDGSTKLDLLRTTFNTRLPVNLVWSSPEHLEFYLDVNAAELEDEALGEHYVGGNTEFWHHDVLLRLGFGLASENVGGRSGHRALHYQNHLLYQDSTEVQSVRYTYKRVDVEARPGQTHGGLWSGMYGPHGLEIVAVSYAHDQIIATKILGDPHVPCNELTFQAVISSKSENISPDLQRLGGGIQNNIVTVYSGKGRIAGYHFSNPQWVTGQLLIHNNGGISFLWEDVNFVIRFYKLDLPSLYNNDQVDNKVVD